MVKTSLDVRLHFGAAQGYILEPNTYFKYIKPVGKIINKSHCYGDDTQVCMILNQCAKWVAI